MMFSVPIRKAMVSLLLVPFAVFAAGEYRILVAPGAPPAEQTAAKEMQLLAGRLLGSPVPIVDKAEAPGRYIRIGATGEAAKALGVDFAKFGDNELIIRQVGDDLYLAGGSPRGTLYAVYEYLERFCGVRFLAPGVEHLPPLKTPGELPAADFRFSPRIRNRQVSLRRQSAEELAFAARMRLNATFNRSLPLPPELGGGEYMLGCHTFLRFAPSTKAGLQKNPEFYAMIGGKRVHDGQLCLTNEKLRAHTTEYIRKWLHDNPFATRVSISMNDYNRFCQCPECTKWLKEHDGVISDILLDFVNDIAARLEKEFPKLEVVTLAYLDARKPPRTVKPRHNVGIFYCLIEADGSKPFSHERNQWMCREIDAWRKTGAKIYLWTYVTNDKYFFLPQPNWDATAQNIRDAFRAGTEWYFCEYAFDRPMITDFYWLRFYVMSRLLWDPEKSLDELIGEFCVPYYGPAAPEIIEALKILRRGPAQNPEVYVCNFASSVMRSVGKENFLAAYDAMQRARAKAAADPVFRERVELAAIPFDLSLMHDGFDLRGALPESLKDFDPLTVLDRDVKFMKARGLSRYHVDSICTWEEFRRRVVRLWGKNDGTLPEGMEAVPGTLIWSAAEFHRPLKRGMKFVDDPEAFGGRAARLVADGRRIWRLELENALRGKYRICVLAKIECDGNHKGVALTGSVLESAARWRVWNNKMTAPMPADPGKGYRLFTLGVFAFQGSYDLFISAANDPAIRDVRIDRVILVPVK